MHTVPQVRRPFHGAALGAVTAAVALATAACGSSPSTSPQAGASSSTATHHPMTHHPMTHHPMTEAMIGSDCGMIPASGMGSTHSMSMEPLLAAASHDPLLMAFAVAAGRAGLTADLSSMHSFTVFAPATTAFARLPAATMAMLHSKAELAKILKYHIVSATITPAQIARGGTVTTVEGSQLKLSRMGAVYEVNNAAILCGNLHTENATVYIISKVLTPMH